MAVCILGRRATRLTVTISLFERIIGATAHAVGPRTGPAPTLKVLRSVPSTPEMVQCDICVFCLAAACQGPLLLIMSWQHVHQSSTASMLPLAETGTQ